MFENVPQSGHNYDLVTDQSLADFVLVHPEEGIDSKFCDVVKPLSRKDIQTFTWDMNDRPTGRASGFYCSLPKYLFDERRHSTMSYPLPYNELVSEFSKHDASLDFSFLGKISDKVRKKLVNHFSKSQNDGNHTVRISNDMPWSWANDVRNESNVRLAKEEFTNLLRVSKFILCPRGYGTGTFRMFEAMQAGRVPVIISNAYVKPFGIDWDSCSLTVPEERIGDIPMIIASRMNDWETLASNARAVWEENFSPSGAISTIATRLAAMSEAISRGSFSPWRHSARMCGAVLQEHIRPVAGRLKQALRLV